MSINLDNANISIEYICIGKYVHILLFPVKCSKFSYNDWLINQKYHQTKNKVVDLIGTDHHSFD